MTTEAVFEKYAPAPRFGGSLRGYDRAQVDEYVADNARWTAQAWTRITVLQERLSSLERSEAPERVRQDVDGTVQEARQTVDRFVEQVDAKASELEEAVRKGTRPQLDELRDRVVLLEGERRSALDHLSRLRESLGSLHADFGPGNGHDTGDADGGRASDQTEPTGSMSAASRELEDL
jgi:cell division septum initiation protein DivIVA